MKKISLAVLLSLFSIAAAVQMEDKSFREKLGSLFHANVSIPPIPNPPASADSVHRWNQIAVDASGLDHTPVAPGDPRVFGEQLGPGRSARAMAVVHIAI